MNTGQEGNTTKAKNNLSDITSSKDKALPSSGNAPAPAPAPAPSPAKPVTSTSTSTPAKKEPEPPAFEKELVTQLTSQFGDRIKVAFIRPLRMKIEVDPSDLVEIATLVRDTLGFDHAESVAGTDYPKTNQIEVTYHLGSYTKDNLAAHILSLATRTSRDDARLPTLINVYKSVEYHERETFEMLGVYFEGHPRNERFLLPEDWADLPPLRKEFRIKGR
jgi:NADH:ubiquinone oxidoreductase subunit C